MAELAFEYLLAALEATRGTPAGAPTHHLGLAGTVTPKKERYRPNESRGTLAEYYRSVDVRRWSEWEAEGGLDVRTLPLILNTLVAGGIDGSGATQAAATIAPTGANNALDFEAVAGGAGGNAISVEYIDPKANSSPLDIDATGRAIRVYLATDANGDITTVAGDIITAIAAHPVAGGLVTAVNSGIDTGIGLVTAMPAQYLSGGTGAEVTQPPDAVLTHLWVFAPTMNADDLQALTLWWGDPNWQTFQAAYCMPDELTISADASGTDGVTLSLSGQGRFPAKVAKPVIPAIVAPPLLMPAAMQVWIDSTNAIGTTEVLGRVLSAEVTLPLNGSRKWLAAGPTGGLDFQAMGRGKRHMELRLTVELPDLTQYEQWVAQASLKARLRLNGPAIETVGAVPVTYYHYVEVDCYGPFDGLEWGEFESTNRTAELTILSEYNEDAGYDWCVRVQNDSGSL